MSSELLDGGTSRAELRRLELRSKRRVNADLIGRYRSSFRGSGLLFSDLRLYEPGDDVRNIHWKVTARTGKPYVKTFEEERQLTIVLVVDISNSTNFGAPRTNHRKAIEFAALIATLTQQTQDKCGLLLFGKDIVEFVKPTSKRSQFKRVIGALMAAEVQCREANQGTDIDKALRYLAQHVRNPSVIFLVSDFFCDGYAESLKFVGARHDLIGVYLEDGVSFDLSPLGLIELQDSEGGGRYLVDTSNKSVRAALRAKAKERRDEILSAFAEANSEIIELRDHVLEPLIRLMNKRLRH